MKNMETVIPQKIQELLNHARIDARSTKKAVPLQVELELQKALNDFSPEVGRHLLEFILQPDVEVIDVSRGSEDRYSGDEIAGALVMMVTLLNTGSVLRWIDDEIALGYLQKLSGHQMQDLFTRTARAHLGETNPLWQMVIEKFQPKR